MNFYIATSLENWKQHKELSSWMLACGHSITYDWTNHDHVYMHGLDAMRQVSINESRGVADADVVIVLWPGGRGTHVELGIAIALDIPVFLMSTVTEHHHACRETCAFYHHPLVRRSKSIAELQQQLLDYYAECVIP